MNYENILVATENSSIATITINRPTKLNALTEKTIEELHQAFQSLEKNYDTRVIILTGSGEKLCCRCRYI
jgi:enoyl-CoA hydratase